MDARKTRQIARFIKEEAEPTDICIIGDVNGRTANLSDVHMYWIMMTMDKGDSRDQSNYRGIAIIGCLGKLFTCCVNRPTRLTSYSKTSRF